MSDRFEVGKRYGAADDGLDPIEVLKRTAKCIVVRNGCGNEWRMVIREDDNGEYVQDSTIRSVKWKYAFVYRAKWEVQ